MKSRITYIIILILITSCGNREVSYQENDNIFRKLFEFQSNSDKIYRGKSIQGRIIGESVMTLKEGKEVNNRRDKVIRTRSQFITPVSGNVNQLDETFTVTDLVMKSKDTSQIPLKYPPKYINNYIIGKVTKLKNSIDNGEIVDAFGEGEIVFALDSINKEMYYSMLFDDVYTHDGKIELTKNTHLEALSIFYDSISNNLKSKIIDSYNMLEFSKNIIKNEGKYFIEIDREEIFGNSETKPSGSKKIKKTFNIKNISSMDFGSGDPDSGYLLLDSQSNNDLNIKINWKKYEYLKKMETQKVNLTLSFNLSNYQKKSLDEIIEKYNRNRNYVNFMGHIGTGPINLEEYKIYLHIK
jgi:hypothetical protein